MVFALFILINCSSTHIIVVCVYSSFFHALSILYFSYLHLFSKGRTWIMPCLKAQMVLAVVCARVFFLFLLLIFWSSIDNSGGIDHAFALLDCIPVRSCSKEVKRKHSSACIWYWCLHVNDWTSCRTCLKLNLVSGISITINFLGESLMPSTSTLSWKKCECSFFATEQQILGLCKY